MSRAKPKKRPLGLQTRSADVREIWEDKRSRRTIERIVKTQRITYTQDIGWFIKQAACLVPNWLPLEVRLEVSGSGSPVLDIFFGRVSDSGRENVDLCVLVALEQSDTLEIFGAMAAYMSRRKSKLLHVRLEISIDEDFDGSGGEELPVPQLSEATLAKMETPAGVQ